MGDDFDEIHTPPQPLTGPDRVAIERRITAISVRVDAHVKERSDEIDRFYATRMMPLEDQVRRANERSSVSKTIAIIGLVLIGVLAIAIGLILYVLMTFKR